MASGRSSGSRPARKSRRPVRNVVPDSVDLRDRLYQPTIRQAPPPELEPRAKVPILDQGQTSACTGFALATVILSLETIAGRKAEPVSPHMLYAMARRYDDIPGPASADTGSSVRGAMKGWYKHGACALRLWPGEKTPAASSRDAKSDWSLDAMLRPLGAYYRVDHRSVVDMQVALFETGALLASAGCHSGWDEGADLPASRSRQRWVIPKARPKPGEGHAFALVGYTREGFIVHNSWDTGWGTRGEAILTYDDWIENAWDCWVAQLGVVTESHVEVSKSRSIVVHAGQVRIASDSRVRSRQVDPFIIDVGNNGQLSTTGDYRTTPDDVHALMTDHLGEAKRHWGLGANGTVDIAVYAHGGLVPESGAAATAAKWFPKLYAERVFPVFVMWETDAWSTLKDRLSDALHGVPQAAGGMFDPLHRFWNTRLERAFAPIGSMFWDEMKQNAELLSTARGSAGEVLLQALDASPHTSDPARARLHLIGHSAGSIVHSHLGKKLLASGRGIESLSLMAPAVRVDTFERCLGDALRTRRIARYNEYHLSDELEQRDPTCQGLLMYSRSLLYLVSQSFEHGQVTPILGMARYFDAENDAGRLPNVRVAVAVDDQTRSTTHGGFDDDPATMDSVVRRLRA